MMNADGICRFYDLKKNEDVELKVDQSTPWIGKLLQELEDEIDPSDFEGFPESTMNFDGHIKKGTGGKFGEYFALSGKLLAKYRTLDVKTGQPMQADLDIDLHLCCIEDESKDKFELEEELVIYLGEEEYDLFFFDGKKIDVAEIFREMIFLEKEEYPTLESEE